MGLLIVTSFGTYRFLLCDVWSCLLIRMFLFFAWVEQLWEALQLVAMRHCHTDSDSKQIKYDSQHNMASSFWGSNMFQLQTAHFHDAIQLDQHCLKSGFFFQNPSHPLTPSHWPSRAAFGKSADKLLYSSSPQNSAALLELQAIVRSAYPFRKLFSWYG